jgi:hypothetical protein
MLVGLSQLRNPRNVAQKILSQHSPHVESYGHGANRYAPYEKQIYVPPRYDRDARLEPRYGYVRTT